MKSYHEAKTPERLLVEVIRATTILVLVKEEKHMKFDSQKAAPSLVTPSTPNFSESSWKSAEKY
jgi:hypothetical protein